MGELAVDQARRNFSEAVSRVAYGKERIVLTRRRKGLAVLVPMEDLAVLEAMEDKRDAEQARRILADPKEKRIPYRTLRRKWGLK